MVFASTLNWHLTLIPAIPTIRSVASTIVPRPARSRRSWPVFPAVCLLLSALAIGARGDELILDQSSIATKRGGDFTLSVSSDAFFHRDVCYLANLDATNVEVSAGQLWTHFKSHGIDSLDRLILFMDVDPNSLANGPIELENLQVIIEDPERPGTVLTQASLDRDDPTNRIVWTSKAGRKTVARVELELGYDFMSRFSSGSEQKLVLHLTTADGTIPITKVGISGERDTPLESRAIMLVLFLAFWAGVFAIMYRMTLPKTTDGKSGDSSLSGSQVAAENQAKMESAKAPVDSEVPASGNELVDANSHAGTERSSPNLEPALPALPPTDSQGGQDVPPCDVETSQPH